MSPQELSKKLNKKEHFIEKLESNLYKRDPSLDTIDRLSRIFNISLGKHERKNSLSNLTISILT